MQPKETLRSVRAAASTIANGGVRIDESTVPGAGLGLFAGRAFRSGDVITLYTGELLSYEQARLRPSNSHMRSLIALRYVLDGLRMSDGTPIVDARRQLRDVGAAAFVNDPRGTARSANAVFDFVDDRRNKEIMRQFVRNPGIRSGEELDPNGRVVLRADTAIGVGEEIFASYGADYWARLDNDGFTQDDDSMNDFIVGDDDFDSEMASQIAHAHYQARSFYGRVNRT